VPFRRQRQAELPAFEDLTLALVVAAQHQRLCRRVEIKPDDVPELLLELRTFDSLKVRVSVASGHSSPRCAHRAGRHAGMARHTANTPASAALWRARQLQNDPRDLVLGERGPAAAAGLIGPGRTRHRSVPVFATSGFPRQNTRLAEIAR
jgi:hypothetical protein